MTTKKNRTPREAWDALVRQAHEDEMDRILALSPAELEKELREEGFDVEEERRLGAARIEELFAWRKRQAWKKGAQARLDTERARFDDHVAQLPDFGSLSRDALIERILAAKADPRLSSPATVRFRNKNMEKASVEELRAILQELLGLPDKKK
jgi:hypothetical protein